MSTEFRTVSTDEWAFVRWCGPDTRPDETQNVDFGNVSHAMNVVEAARRGESFVSETGEVWSGDEVAAAFMGEGTVPGCRPGAPRVRMVATFGDFGGTFAVGSGDLSTFEGL